jgi:hypothetical protein
MFKFLYCTKIKNKIDLYVLLIRSRIGPNVLGLAFVVHFIEDILPDVNIVALKVVHVLSVYVDVVYQRYLGIIVGNV